MILIKQLSFEPNDSTGKKIEPVIFDTGINLVIGEKSEGASNKKEKDKMNGVGKTLLIEAINYCLLKKAVDSRITKIPEPVLSPEVYICLKLEIETDSKIKNVIIKRNRVESNPIIIIVDGDEKTFDSLETAKKYLEHLFFYDTNLPDKPSLRSLLSILIREESSLYNNILFPYHKSSLTSFEELIKPHLYLFQIDLTILDQIKALSEKLNNIKKILTSVREDFKYLGVEEKAVASYINELKDNVEKLNFAIGELKPAEGMNQVQKDLNDLEFKLEQLIAARGAKEFFVKKIKSMPAVEDINTKKIRMVYNHYKSGLGDLVEKSFEQVLNFKKEIDDFQTTLMNEKLNTLVLEISVLDSQISQLDTEISKLYSKYNAKEKIDSLKEVIKLEREKNSELEKLTSSYAILQSKISQQKEFKKKKTALIDDLGVMIFGIRKTVDSFEEDLKKMHDYIAGNKQCQFDIEIGESISNFVEFQYRVKRDGSSGINRIKTFIYDVLLMVNNVTSQRHPGFLIHDNIFASSGKDDMVKSLNYLNLLSKKNKFQYILTINKDEFESSIDEFNFNYKTVVKAEFTRSKPFLGSDYSEIG